MSHRSTFHIVAITVVAFLAATLQQSAYAGVISTQQYLGSLDRQQAIARVDAVLAREEVRKQLEQFGVSPDEAHARVAALSDRELQSLAHRVGQVPAGGSILALFGVVFIVLLILEVLGVTDIFKKI